MIKSAQDAGICRSPAGQTLVSRPFWLWAGDAKHGWEGELLRHLRKWLGYRYYTTAGLYRAPSLHTDGDLNYDGKVNFFDLSIILLEQLPTAG